MADVTLKAVQENNCNAVLLLGTKHTMNGDFYAARFKAKGVNMFIPEKNDMELINATIYNEFGKGIFPPETKKLYLDIIRKFIPMGVDGVILGCTEIPLLLKQDDSAIPLFDTAKLHAVAGAGFANW